MVLRHIDLVLITLLVIFTVISNFGDDTTAFRDDSSRRAPPGASSLPSLPADQGLTVRLMW